MFLEHSPLKVAYLKQRVCVEKAKEKKLRNTSERKSWKLLQVEIPKTRLCEPLQERKKQFRNMKNKITTAN